MNKTANHFVGLGEILKVDELPGYLNGDGDVIEIDNGNHGGAAFVIWRMADDERSPRCEEFAHRLVASTNACAGISIENLENNLSVKWLADQYNTVIRQRDELLSALELIANGSIRNIGSARIIARKAIDSVNGGAA